MRKNTKRKKNKKTRWEFTTIMRANYSLLMMLEDDKAKVFSQAFYQKKISMREKLEYIKATSMAKSDFWSSVYAEYPELNSKSLTADGDGIRLTTP